MGEPRYIRAMRRALHELIDAYGTRCPITEELRLAIKDVKALTASAPQHGSQASVRRGSVSEGDKNPRTLVFRYRMVWWPQSEP